MSNAPVEACWDSAVVRFDKPHYPPPYNTLVVEVVSLGAGRWSSDRFFYPYPSGWAPGAKLLIRGSTPLYALRNVADDTVTGIDLDGLYWMPNPTDCVIGVLPETGSNSPNTGV